MMYEASVRANCSVKLSAYLPAITDAGRPTAETFPGTSPERNVCMSGTEGSPSFRAKFERVIAV